MFMLPTFKFNIERWKYNPYFELWVSNMGHIRNRDKKDIAPKVMNNGYMAVKVHGSLNRYMLLHRVVMLTWKPTPEAEKLTVDHLDHNKRNNAVSNLEWVTKTENESRARRDFLNVSKVVGAGEIILVEDKKKKRVTILGLYVYSNHKAYKMKSTFIPISQPEKIHEVLAPYYGRVPDMSKKGIDKIVKAIFDGSNTAGVKKYCNFHFQAKVETVIEEITKIQYKKERI